MAKRKTKVIKMKNGKVLIAMFITAFFAASSLQAQEKPEKVDGGKNEIKINLGYTIFEILELTYERTIVEEFAVGLSLSGWFNTNDYINFMANPYFRFYPFPTKEAAGFFVEGNAAIVSYDAQEFVYIQGSNGGFGYYTESDSKNDWKAGAGFAVGFKFISKSNFMGEGYLGIGRLFQEDNVTEFYPRAGLTFGRRF